MAMMLDRVVTCCNCWYIKVLNRITTGQLALERMQADLESYYFLLSRRWFERVKVMSLLFSKSCSC